MDQRLEELHLSSVMSVAAGRKSSWFILLFHIHRIMLQCFGLEFAVKIGNRLAGLIKGFLLLDQRAHLLLS